MQARLTSPLAEAMVLSAMVKPLNPLDSLIHFVPESLSSFFFFFFFFFLLVVVNVDTVPNQTSFLPARNSWPMMSPPPPLVNGGLTDI